MLQIMLCGAEDTRRVRDQFFEVVRDYGGDPWHYSEGGILHVNSMSSGWAKNSRLSVRSADLLVFVIVESYGTITWRSEFQQAMRDGKPFLVLSLDSTYERYLTLIRHIADTAAIVDEGERSLVDLMRQLESEHELTIVQFRDGHFGDVLRRQLAGLFSHSLRLVAERSVRSALLPLLRDPLKLSKADLRLAAVVAVDELEAKSMRKFAITALAVRGGTDEETVTALLASLEQGVQRLAIDRLESLYRQRPPDRDFLDQCVAIANNSDDVGIARRLVPALFRLDVEGALYVLDGLDLGDVGTRRRVALALEQYESEIVEGQLVTLALGLASRCEIDAEPAWRSRLRALVERLQTSANRAPPTALSE